MKEATYHKRKCIICGKWYVPTSRAQKSCKDRNNDVKPCCICGKLTYVTLDTYKKDVVCSNECRSEKRRKTNLERYGVDNPSKSEEVKTKIRNTFQERYGVDYYTQTEEYSKKSSAAWKGKSKEEWREIEEKRATTSIERYGESRFTKTSEGRKKIRKWAEMADWDEINAKKRQTCRSKYGVDHPFKDPEVRHRSEMTILDRYGSQCYLQSDDYREKRLGTCLDKYGVSWPQQTRAWKDKIVDTVSSRYGYNNVSQVPQIKEKMRETFLNKYGVDNPMKSEEIKKKTAETCLNRYGSKSYLSSLGRYTEDFGGDEEKAETWLQFKNEPTSFISDMFGSVQPTIQDLEDILCVTNTPILDVIHSHNIEDLIDMRSSSMERQICSILGINEVTFIRNDRKHIRPKELDIYIPELHLAIECNPTVTHNSSFCDPWGGDPKSPSYHMNKSLTCKEHGIFLFHIFGYEWAHKRDIIESMVTNLIGKTPNKIYARNTEVREVSSKDARVFLNMNHRQGNTNGSIRLGLYHESELVSLMTFNKVRATMGDTKFDYELSRFCNKLYTNVVGGASKLFKYFINNYSCNSIVSFSDVAHTRGSLYETLGFIQNGKPQSNYGWVNIYTDEWVNRVNCQKRNLSNMFDDVTEETIRSHTEREIMESHGFAQVYESGTLRWEWNR